MKKQTFEIPKGCSKVTVEQVGNTIVTTFESEKHIPKVGDCVKFGNATGTIYFGQIKEKYKDRVSSFIAIGANYFNENDYWFLNVEGCTETKITPEELQAEFNKLGYEYDFESHTAKKIRWKPDNGEKYWFVNSDGGVDWYIFDDDSLDNRNFNSGNCYRTPEEAEPRRQHYLNFKD